MKELSLYPEPPFLAVEEELSSGGKPVDPNCQLCPLFDKVRSPCMPAEGDPGGLLVVGEGPQLEDDRQGVPFVGPTGSWIRQQISKSWTGPVVYDHAIRCAPGSRTVTVGAITACRGYLAKTVLDASPTRVLALGTDALKGLVGRSFHLMSSRRGYAYMHGLDVPVFFLMPPTHGMRNRFIRSWLEEDLEWALTTPDPPRPPTHGLVRYVQTAEEAEDACFELASSGEFTFDTETFGAPHDPEFSIVTLACTSIGSVDAWVWDEAALKNPATAAPIAKLLTNPRVLKIGQNVKFDQLAVRAQLGIQTRGVSFDVRLVRKLLMADAHSGLEVMQSRVGMAGAKDEVKGYVDAAVANIRNTIANTKNLLTPTGRPRAKKAVEPFGLDPVVEQTMLSRVDGGVEPRRYAYRFMPEAVRGVYCARDSVSTGLLKSVYASELKARPELDELWRTVTLPLMHAITELEWRGIKISVPALRQLQTAMAAKEAELRAQIAPYVWADFNPNASSPDTGKLLFGDKANGGLGLKPTRLTPTGKPGTSVDDIESIKHPVVAMILELRKVMHFKSQYADGMAFHVRGDGRIHTSYKIDGTETGRPSTEEPNLLNIPRAESPAGKMCRDLFIAEDGFKLIEADYNQIELRVAAMLSQDDLMISTFKSGADFHLATAKMISPTFGVHPDEVTKEHPLRSRAKIVNFSTLYGKSAAGLAYDLGIKKPEAQALIDAILGKYSKLARWIQERLNFARRNGYCRTWWNGKDARYRPLWQISSNNDEERETAERSSWNTPVQGTATEFTNASLGAIQKWIDDEGLNDHIRLVLTVYDSIVAEVREGFEEEYAYNANRIMTGWESWGMPIKADFKKGYAWGSLEGFHV